MGTVHAKESKISGNMNETWNKNREKQNFKASNPSPNAYRKLDLFDKTQEGHIDIYDVKVRVDRVHVDGLGRTKDDIIKPQVTDLFKAKDFYEVILCASKVKEKLRSLGCFKSIGVYIDTSHGPDATPKGIEVGLYNYTLIQQKISNFSDLIIFSSLINHLVETQCLFLREILSYMLFQVTFFVREMSRLTGGINTMVGNNEGSVIVQAKAPNLLGRAEHLQMEYSYGSKSSTNISVSLVKPFVNSWLHTVLTTSIFNTFNRFPWSGFNQFDKGLLLDFALNPDGAGILKHNLQYEANYREIVSSKQTSFRVREQCGPNLKSALRHICCIDKRDSLLFPTTGSFVQFSTEVAGLGGDIGFVKNELVMQTNWTPHEFFTFQLGLQSGLLRGINNEMKVNIADQFFLGGPLNLRGFEMRGCGPRDDGYSIGGDAYWAVALHLYTPLPFRPGRNGFGDLFKLHGFINGGNVSNFTFKFDDNYRDNMKIFTENVRCSAGGGIAMKLGNIARVELNFIMPLLFLRSDILQQFQFGIGLQYL